MKAPEPRRGGFRISEWAIRNPVPVAVLFIGAVIAGLFSYTALPIKNFPNINFPAVLIQVTRSGAAPAEMETQVTRPVENALAGLSNVESIASNVTQGTSVTIIEFKLGEDTQKVYDDVKSKVDQIRNTLPKEIDPPIVQRLEMDDAPIVTYTLSAPSMSEQELSWFIDNTVSRDLQAQEGVSQIQRLGGLDREVNVLIDPDRLAAQGLTASQVNDALAQADVDEPGGRVTIGGREQILRVLGAAVTVDRIRNLSIPASGGRFVRLSDVADVGDGAAEPRAFALLDGRPVVAFSVLKTKLASEVSTENRVDAEIVRLGKQYPQVTFRKVNSQVDQTRAAFSATAHTLLEGMILASLVVWLFLRDWRATAITAVAMPVSLIPTFAFMALLGFSLNVVTLLGLTLVIGILVDDAIVEVENIEKRVYVGLRPFRAAIEGADQIGLAVVATTFSIVAVFFPVAFMPGIPGQFFREFGITVSVAVLFSLVVARLLTPLLAAYLLTPKVAKIRKPLPRYYTRTLTWAIDHRIYA
ncbi:MAG: efflux RND transporter permease subunit, partial [Caulobacteraceae bacterium]|nr:efflux RND transporter permease subunit [Caulobacteraceae bacterium]